MQPNIELHIEELVLHGFTGYGAYHIAEAVEREITRLLQERGLPPSFSMETNVEHLNAVNFNMQQNDKAASIGNSIAKSVYQGLQNENSGSF